MHEELIVRAIFMGGRRRASGQECKNEHRKPSQRKLENYLPPPSSVEPVAAFSSFGAGRFEWASQRLWLSAMRAESEVEDEVISGRAWKWWDVDGLGAVAESNE